MRVFKVRAFARWARKERISDLLLRNAVAEMKSGLTGAALGGGVYKKRIAVSSRGTRGGARTIVAFHVNKHTFFVFGFLKNERANVDDSELKAFRRYAKLLFDLSEKQICELINTGELVEVC